MNLRPSPHDDKQAETWKFAIFCLKIEPNTQQVGTGSSKISQYSERLQYKCEIFNKINNIVVALEIYFHVEIENEIPDKELHSVKSPIQAGKQNYFIKYQRFHRGFAFLDYVNIVYTAYSRLGRGNLVLISVSHILPNFRNIACCGTQHRQFPQESLSLLKILSKCVVYVERFNLK